jgi:prophage antirepressor-like protein
VFGVSNGRDAISRLDNDEKGVGNIDTLGGKQDLVIINESGLYSLVLTSRKSEAKRFKKWVTGEVLPSIRKTGSYNSNDTKIDRLIELMMQTNSNLTALINNMAIRHEPKIETPKYFEPSSNDNSISDINLYHRIVNYGKKFRPDLDQSQVREQAREIGMIASRLSKERKIRIVEEDNLDSRYPGKIKYYHQDILKEVFRLNF